MPRNPLSIVETSHYRESIRELGLSPRQEDELLEGVLFVIARDPTEGTRITSGSRVWAMPFESIDSATESFVLYYSFDLKKIHLLALRQSNDE